MSINRTDMQFHAALLTVVLFAIFLAILLIGHHLDRIANVMERGTQVETTAPGGSRQND